MRTCYQNGIWAIYSALDPRALQFKPGLLCDRELCDDILNRLDTAVGQARAEALGTGRKIAYPSGGTLRISERSGVIDGAGRMADQASPFSHGEKVPAKRADEGAPTPSRTGAPHPPASAGTPSLPRRERRAIRSRRFPLNLG